MPLPKTDMSDCVRHLEYPVIGLFQASLSGQSLAYGGAGYRYFGAFGNLLYRLNLLAPDEESRLTGRSYGSIGFTGVTPQPGDTVSVTVTGGGLQSPLTVNVTVPTKEAGKPPWTLLNVAAALAQAFLLSPAFIAAGFTAIADYGSGPFSGQTVPVPICSIIAAPCRTFTMTASYTGITVPQVIVNGLPLSPYLSFAGPTGEVVKVWGYLPILNYLEGAYGGETATLSAAVADTVTLAGNRLEQRDTQYRYYQEKLATFLGIPVNQQRQGASNNQVQFG